MKNFYLLAILALLGCTNESSSRKTLDAMSFTEIEFSGYDPFSCSDDDMFATGFRALNSKGVRVSGTVCCGVFKNCTVRF